MSQHYTTGAGKPAHRVNSGGPEFVGKQTVLLPDPEKDTGQQQAASPQAKETNPDKTRQGDNFLW